jgi:two-component system OmpR family response regulator
VLVVDRMLPRRDGLSLISESARANGNIHTPVLILSALGEVDDRVTGPARRRRRLSAKPYAFSELLARIEVLGRARAPGSGDQVYRVGDLELDRLSHTVRAPARKSCCSRASSACSNI